MAPLRDAVSLIDDHQLNGNLLNKASGLCLDVTGGGSANGTALEAWSCGANQLNQIWSLPA